MRRALIFLPLLCLLALIGCGTEAQRGQLLLAIETDMAVPKDIDEVVIRVTTPTGVDTRSTKLDGTPDGTLPGTWGITAGTDPDVTFTVTVFGLKAGEVRVIRDVRTALPVEGVRVLRVELQWLCANQAANGDFVVKDADGGAKSTCTAEKTCVAGSCQVVTFTAPARLSELGETAYGQDGGACFETTACFAAAHAEKLTSSAVGCFFEQPTGVDLTADNATFNVALAVPEGSSDGFCRARQCLIPLDYDPAASGVGWWAEQRRVYVPYALCSRGVSVVWSRSCAPKSEVTQVCQGGAPPIEDIDAGDGAILADSSADVGNDAVDGSTDARRDSAPDVTRTPDARPSDAGDTGLDGSLDAARDSAPPDADAGAPAPPPDAAPDVDIIEPGADAVAEVAAPPEPAVEAAVDAGPPDVGRTQDASSDASDAQGPVVGPDVSVAPDVIDVPDVIVAEDASAPGDEPEAAAADADNPDADDGFVDDVSPGVPAALPL